MPVKATKPCILQVNNSGAWKNVVRFDAADKVHISDVETAAELLHTTCPRTTFRLVTDDGLQDVLFHLSEGEWRKA